MNIVAGLKRSGTSAMMLALKRAGIMIIGKEMADEHNPTGHWECGATMRGLSKYDNYFKRGYVKLIFSGLNQSDRTAIGKAIVMVRNPRTVIGSLKKCGMYSDSAVQKMAYDSAKAFYFLRGVKHIVVSYEDLLENPEEIMKQVCGFVGEGDYIEGAKAIDKGLNRSSVFQGNCEGLEKLEELYKQFYEKKIKFRPQTDNGSPRVP